MILLIGILCVFMCPMVFGGLTMYLSHKEIHEETLDRWSKLEEKNDD